MTYSHCPICKKRQEMAHSLCAKGEEDLAEHCGMRLPGVGTSESEVLCSSLTFCAMNIAAMFATP